MPEFSIESIDFDSTWVLLAIVVAAIVQDDLTCLVVGSAVAAGEAQPLPSAVACLAGIWLGFQVGIGLLCPQQVTGFGIHRIDGCLNVSEVDGISSVSVASNGTNAD